MLVTVVQEDMTGQSDTLDHLELVIQDQSVILAPKGMMDQSGIRVHLELDMMDL